MADLNLYEVGVRNHTTTMKLSDEDAKAYKDRDGVSVKKVGSVDPARRQPVTAPEYAVDDEGKELPKTEPGGVRQRSRAPKNK